tara:strand:- start:2116 stop:2559 length:444 start_codon:yes stop_codon:yes gene_type:complete
MVDYKADYKDRTAKGANVAETKCVEFLDSHENFHWYKFGFDETDRNIPSEFFFKIPETLRNAPDYVCIKNKAFFLECKGYKDYLKIKEDDLKGYMFWNRMMDLFFFAYDCINHKHHVLSFDKLSDKIPESEIDTYPDNHKIYYKVRL